MALKVLWSNPDENMSEFIRMANAGKAEVTGLTVAKIQRKTGLVVRESAIGFPGTAYLEKGDVVVVERKPAEGLGALIAYAHGIKPALLLVGIVE